MTGTSAPLNLYQAQADTNAVSSVRSIIMDLNDFLAGETLKIRDNLPVDYAMSIEKKSRFLHQLNRAVKLVDFDRTGSTLSEELQLLKSALKENEGLLKAHILAVGDVSKMLIDIVKDEESDGTYDSSPGARFT